MIRTGQNVILFLKYIIISICQLTVNEKYLLKRIISNHISLKKLIFHMGISKITGNGLKTAPIVIREG